MEDINGGDNCSLALVVRATVLLHELLKRAGPQAAAANCGSRDSG
jgi:hypothetical protein